MVIGNIEDPLAKASNHTATHRLALVGVCFAPSFTPWTAADSSVEVQDSE